MSHCTVAFPKSVPNFKQERVFSLYQGPCGGFITDELLKILIWDDFGLIWNFSFDSFVGHDFRKISWLSNLLYGRLFWNSVTKKIEHWLEWFRTFFVWWIRWLFLKRICLFSPKKLGFLCRISFFSDFRIIKNLEHWLW